MRRVRKEEKQEEQEEEKEQEEPEEEKEGVSSKYNFVASKCVHTADSTFGSRDAPTTTCGSRDTAATT